MPRDRQINLRVSEEEAVRFDRVAAQMGLPVGAMIRTLVRREDEALAPRLTAASITHASARLSRRCPRAAESAMKLKDPGKLQ